MAKKNDPNQVKKELAEMTEMAKRTMADLQNLRRRNEEEKRNFITLANAELISGILPALDNLEKAKEHVPAENSEWFKGIEMSINQLHQTLNEAGLKPIETTGQKFNPNFHTALSSCPGDENIVMEELEKGYMLGSRVIRHAKVKVGNGKKE